MNRIISSVVVFLFSISIYAFSGSGSGTEKSPYMITSANELFEVRGNLSAFYKLANDIDLSEWNTENSPIYGWTPIGTSSSPFTGSFDGNGMKIINLKIKREQDDYVGLFGYVSGASFSNIWFINAEVSGQDNVGTIAGFAMGGTYKNNITINSHITGRNNVGAILGQHNSSNRASLNFLNCYVVGGFVVGNQNIGGIIGSSYTVYDSGEMNINVCHSSAEIIGIENCGGICGFIDGKAKTTQRIRDCFAVGNVVGSTSVGGILGHAQVAGGAYHSELVCEKNYIKGCIKGVSNTSGIAGFTKYSSSTYVMSSNFCIADTIEGSYRISPNVSNVENFSLSSTVHVDEDGHTAFFEDCAQNGTSLGSALLKMASTYQAIGWDFSTVWKDMSLHNQYPIHLDMSPAPVVHAFEAKSKGMIKGSTTFNNGKIYCIIDNVLYTSEIEDGKWELVLGNTNKGKKALLAACEIGKIPSSIVTAFAENTYDEQAVVIGDSNSDGVVDAADVVGTINYILGKPSSSFNQQNADVNEDGQILVDDAVGTVNVIMNNQ